VGAQITWDAISNCKSCSDLALCYSIVEYCAALWYRSAHTSPVDV